MRLQWRPDGRAVQGRILLTAFTAADFSPVKNTRHRGSRSFDVAVQQ
jgi:hypothetical protein